MFDETNALVPGEYIRPFGFYYDLCIQFCSNQTLTGTWEVQYRGGAEVPGDMEGGLFLLKRVK